MNNRKRLSFELSLAGISAALAIIFLVLAYYTRLAALACYALAGFSLCLPLYVESLRSTALAYVVSALLGFLFTNYIFAMPFILIFGPHIVLSAVCGKYLRKKWYFTIPIKIVFINIVLFAVFKICGLDSVFDLMAKVGISAKYLWVALIGTPLFIGYDYLIQGVYSFFGRRLYRVFAKYRPQKQTDKTALPTDEEEPDIFFSGKNDAADRGNPTESSSANTVDEAKISADSGKAEGNAAKPTEDKNNGKSDGKSDNNGSNTDDKSDDLFDDN